MFCLESFVAVAREEPWNWHPAWRSKEGASEQAWPVLLRPQNVKDWHTQLFVIHNSKCFNIPGRKEALDILHALSCAGFSVPRCIQHKMGVAPSYSSLVAEGVQAHGCGRQFFMKPLRERKRDRERERMERRRSCSGFI